MADQIRQRTIIVPANTPIAAPQTTNWNLPAAVPQAIRLRVPPGSAGLMGIQIGAGGQVLIPYDVGEWFIADGEVITIALHNWISSGSWMIRAYNTDVKAHQFQVLLELSIADDGAIISQTPSQLFPTAQAAAVAGLGGSDTPINLPDIDQGLDLDQLADGLEITIAGLDDGILSGSDLTVDATETDRASVRFAPDDSNTISPDGGGGVTVTTTPGTPGQGAPPDLTLPTATDPTVPVAVSVLPQPATGDGVFFNAQRGLRYIIRRYTANRGGRSCEYRLYESVLNKADWGAGAGGPILITGTCKP